MKQKFTEFSELTESETPLKHEMELHKHCLCYLCLPDTEVEFWFLTQYIVGLNTIFTKLIYKFCIVTEFIQEKVEYHVNTLPFRTVCGFVN